MSRVIQLKLIVCLDDSFGMLFNKRRLSSDIAVTRDILNMTAAADLWVNNYSAGLFAELSDDVKIDDDFLTKSGKDDYCFVENVNLSECLCKFDKIIIYKWNRRYPSDLKFPVDLLNSNFTLVDSSEFQGNSHPKITKEIFVYEKA